MSTNYDLYYKENPHHSLGDPFREFIDFFDQYTKKNADILDLGCGQGRDSLFITQREHNVTAVDISPTGIDQLAKEAKEKELDIQCIVADIRNFSPSQLYDVIVIDRTLHMCKSDEQIAILETMKNVVHKNGYILIADESENIINFTEFFESLKWKVVFEKKGFLFVQFL